MRRAHALRFRDGLAPKRVFAMLIGQLEVRDRRRVDLKTLRRHLAEHVVPELIPDAAGTDMSMTNATHGDVDRHAPESGTWGADARFAEVWTTFESIARRVAVADAKVGTSTIDHGDVATLAAAVDRAAAILIELGQLRREEQNRADLVRRAICEYMQAFAAPLGSELRKLQAALRRGEPIERRLQALLREDGVAAMLRAAAVVAEREVTAGHRAR